MKKQAFHFDLPPELIAQYPLPERSASRLLTHRVGTDTFEHHLFKHIVDFLEPGDLLVMNNSKVIPARLYGHKASGGKIELLVERIVDDRVFIAHIKASKAPRSGSVIHLASGWSFEVLAKEDDVYRCIANGPLDDMLQEIGHIPLPLYITRTDDMSDINRYQTVYAKHKGSVAAPTAGLHFDETILAALQAKGVHVGYVTLHVGAGTFRPVRVDDIREHTMHAERFTVDASLCAAVASARSANKRVIAVGTTALRSLESAVFEGELQPCSRETNIFIYPGYVFQVCDGLITNFHLPESTLLMLVAAFIGYDAAMALYREAIAKQYRFFSYGDTSLLLRR